MSQTPVEPIEATSSVLSPSEPTRTAYPTMVARPTYPSYEWCQEHLEVYPLRESDIGQEICIYGTIDEQFEQEGVIFGVYRHYSNAIIRVTFDPSITEIPSYSQDCSVVEGTVIKFRTRNLRTGMMAEPIVVLVEQTEDFYPCP
jgi:hypothetical protein